MSNYFTVERQGQCIEKIYLEKEDGTPAFVDVMNMSYEDLRSYDGLSEFVTAVMDASNTYLDECDADTIVTLVGDDDIFIWGILISPTDNEDEFKYATINWKKDGKNFRYQG